MLRASSQASAVVFAVFFLLGAVPGSAQDYLGSGFMFTGQLNRCHTGVYSSECAVASARWNADTDLSITSYTSCGVDNITTAGDNYGNNGWAGMALIYGTNGQWQSFDSTYDHCWALNNSYSLDSWTNNERVFNCLHELGHCWSLAHRQSDSTSVMQQGKLNILQPNSQDITLVNNRY